LSQVFFSNVGCPIFPDITRKVSANLYPSLNHHPNHPAPSSLQAVSLMSKKEYPEMSLKFNSFKKTCYIVSRSKIEDKKECFHGSLKVRFTKPTFTQQGL
jgi:hypothetical protein